MNRCGLHIRAKPDRFIDDRSHWNVGDRTTALENFDGYDIPFMDAKDLREPGIEEQTFRGYFDRL